MLESALFQLLILSIFANMFLATIAFALIIIVTIMLSK